MAVCLVHQQVLLQASGGQLVFRCRLPLWWLSVAAAGVGVLGMTNVIAPCVQSSLNCEISFRYIVGTSAKAFMSLLLKRKGPNPCRQSLIVIVMASL